MRILVTGGAGFIGSPVADGFLAQGHEVAVVDDLSTGNRANLDPSIKLYQHDIRDAALAQVFQDFRPDVVDHHAAQSNVPASLSDPVFDASVNVLGHAVHGSAVVAGTVVTVSVIGTGVVLSAAGEVLAFVPNAIGRALLYNERLS